MVENLNLSEVSEESLEKKTDRELFAFHHHLHELWVGTKKISSPERLAEIWHAHDLGAEEIKKREFIHVSPLNGQKPEIQGEVDKRDFEYVSPIYKVDDEQRMVYGIVLEPNVVDAQGDIVSEEEVAKAAHGFMEHYKKLGVQHEEFEKKLRIMESYLAPEDITIEGQMIRKGTWLMATRVVDDETWEDVKAGNITGYSVGGEGVRIRRES